MKRGDVVIAVAPGEYGKPRPAVIVQADSYALASLTIAPLTSDLQDVPFLRIPVEPDATNGLQKPSQIMIDKILTVGRGKIGQQIGTLDRATMRRVNQALVSFLDLEDAAA
ncbi:type II toxin-antitoxin system PemK/MazF family toxin [Novosphingobium sp. FKTRR1]|uniref:type II toxin-antitoxin system PemK/MazF family toxin n=1 Tax=Novosphingobium sp. FKTRR1 TaxID=2879118 RepID=UPI001CF0D3A3